MPISATPARTVRTTSSGVNTPSTLRVMAGNCSANADISVVSGSIPGRRHRDQVDPPPSQTTRGLHHGTGVLEVAQDLACRSHQLVPGIGERDAAADSTEQLHTQVALETGHRLGQRRLRYVELLGGAAETFVVDDREEVAEYAGIHGHLAGSTGTSHRQHL